MILAIDQGTTSSRALRFSASLEIQEISQQEFPQIYPHPGWVEHDPEAIWQTTLETARAVFNETIQAIGITNQRETVVLWDKATGHPLYHAIVWQDRRTSDYCKQLKAQGLEPMITAKTGLLLDPYFSATKLKWLLDTLPMARERAIMGDLCFGTIDCFLLFRLTGGKVHATDMTNASRTMLYNIHEKNWDNELLALFDIPHAILPEVKQCAAHFGTTDISHFGREVPILGIAGDQQAALIGQGCFTKGMMKSTYGTGCFALLNIGETSVISKNRLLTTIAYAWEGKTYYALEGAIFIAGAAVQWLRDELKIIEKASEMDNLAAKADSNSEVFLVPAFVGLGAPYWDAEARGAILGLTRGSSRAEIAKATLESVGFQTRDLLEAMRKDAKLSAQTTLRVDGGMVSSNFTMQFLSDILQSPIDKPIIQETTALGAAFLAAFSLGLYKTPQDFAKDWKLQQKFTPQIAKETANEKYKGWKKAVKRVLN